MTTRHSSFAIALFCSSAAFVGCSPKIAKGEGYSIPIPAGWQVSHGDVKLPPHALALRQKSKANKDYMIASVVFMPVTPTTPPFDPTSASLCQQVAEGEAKPAGATVKSTAIIDGPMGKTCQTDLLANGGKQAALGTFVKLPASSWMVTCNHDPRDQEAANACQEVLRGIKAD
ncbi:MAG: hypothetical protein ABI332_07095 [Polyangiaceae bacterium]